MKKLLSAAIIGGLIAVAATKIGAGSAPPASPSHLGGAQSAFDRVTATETPRCAYAAYYPFLEKIVQAHLGSKAKLLYQEKSHFEPYGEEK